MAKFVNAICADCCFLLGRADLYDIDNAVSKMYGCCVDKARLLFICVLCVYA